MNGRGGVPRLIHAQCRMGVQELTVEVDMLKAWLPLMVHLDSSFDINLTPVRI